MKQKIDPIAQAMQILQLVTERRNQQTRNEQGQRELDLRERGLTMEADRVALANQMEQERFAKDLGLREKDLLFRQQEVQRQMQEAELKRAMDAVNVARQFGLEERKLTTEAERNQLLDKIRQNESNARAMNILPELLSGYSTAALTPTMPGMPNAMEPMQDVYRQALERLGLTIPKQAAPAPVMNDPRYPTK